MHKLIVHAVKLSLVVPPPTVLGGPTQAVAADSPAAFRGAAAALRLFFLIRAELRMPTLQPGESVQASDTEADCPIPTSEVRALLRTLLPVVVQTAASMKITAQIPGSPADISGDGTTLTGCYVSLAWEMRERHTHVRTRARLARAGVCDPQDAGAHSQVDLDMIGDQQNVDLDMDTFVSDVLIRATSSLDEESRAIAESFIARCVRALQEKRDAIFALRVLQQMLQQCTKSDAQAASVRARADTLMLYMQQQQQQQKEASTQGMQPLLGESDSAHLLEEQNRCAAELQALQDTAAQEAYLRTYKTSTSALYEKHGLVDLVLQLMHFFASPAVCFQLALRTIEKRGAARRSDTNSAKGPQLSIAIATSNCLMLLLSTTTTISLDLSMDQLRALWFAVRQPFAHVAAPTGVGDADVVSAAIEIQQQLRDLVCDWFQTCGLKATENLVQYQTLAAAVSRSNQHTGTLEYNGCDVFRAELHDQIFEELICANGDGFANSSEESATTEPGHTKHGSTPLRLTASGLSCFHQWMQLVNAQRGHALLEWCSEDSSVTNDSVGPASLKGPLVCSFVGPPCTGSDETMVSDEHIIGLDRLWYLALYSNCPDGSQQVVQRAMTVLIDAYIGMRQVRQDDVALVPLVRL